ncbi:hypothetical protein D9M71_413000 [compost metagenome]
MQCAKQVHFIAGVELGAQAGLGRPGCTLARWPGPYSQLQGAIGPGHARLRTCLLDPRKGHSQRRARLLGLEDQTLQSRVGEYPPPVATVLAVSGFCQLPAVGIFRSDLAVAGRYIDLDALCRFTQGAATEQHCQAQQAVCEGDGFHGSSLLGLLLAERFARALGWRRGNALTACEAQRKMT